MKKIISIILIPIIILSIGRVSAQTYGVSDTLSYLQSIVNDKAFYIGKPFSVLRDSLKIEIKYFNQNTDITSDINKETSTSFGFYFPQENQNFYLTYPRIRIKWQTDLNAKQSWNFVSDI